MSTRIYLAVSTFPVSWNTWHARGIDNCCICGLVYIPLEILPSPSACWTVFCDWERDEMSCLEHVPKGMLSFHSVQLFIRSSISSFPRVQMLGSDKEAWRPVSTEERLAEIGSPSSSYGGALFFVFILFFYYGIQTSNFWPPRLLTGHWIYSLTAAPFSC